jgi:4-hydroxy-tetrahydrodipicolinate synthase
MTANHRIQINGIVPIIPTPFASGEQIDWDGFRTLLDFAHAAGSCAACLPAYASEFYKLYESERVDLVREAVRHSSGRIPIIGQVNYASARTAAATAVKLQAEGVAAIGVTVPRLFPLAEADLRRYFDVVLSAVEVPVVIQDFNPGGQSVSVQFIADLNGAYPHFRWVKLEEPMMAGKVRAILRETEGRVGVIEGWGGMYIMELLPAGICGVMPGLALSDLLARVYRLVMNGELHKAGDIFEGVLPQIVYSLQNLELYHRAEKLLLEARGLLRDTSVRQAGMELSEDDEYHITFLNRRILALLERAGLPANPLAPVARRTRDNT